MCFKRINDFFYISQALEDVEGFDGNKEYRTTKSELKKVLEDAVVSLYLLATQNIGQRKLPVERGCMNNLFICCYSVLKSWCFEVCLQSALITIVTLSLLLCISLKAQVPHTAT